MHLGVFNLTAIFFIFVFVIAEFVTQLEYKAQKQGKTILRIGQLEPSTKICSECGYYNRDLNLSDRDWICPDCGIHHDRDINAAINIRKFALDRQNLIGI
ncbi:transposase [Methanoplanus endosymbiosus]|uniref:Transposase n=1 Tax=Methanoplanus endosymbiosus TaxID=33865 RepID=A0A9E7TJN1_9EURY|nr:transposase [Methanoplanus endosymbiosus]UUX93838.1 transposase [Methanoplanus endosymbiosus]